MTRIPFKRVRSASVLVAAAVIGALVPVGPASAVSTVVPITGLASVAPTGKTGNQASLDGNPSGDGRWIVFLSSATDLVPGDTNGLEDVFVRNTLTSVTTRVSVSSSEAQAVGGNSHQPSISYDGRFVAFASNATNLVSGDTNAKTDIFIRDLVLGTTVRASATDGTATQGNNDSTQPAISDDGDQVAFQSDASNLVPFDLNAKTDVFVRTVSTKNTEIISVTSSEAALGAGGSLPAMSYDGTYVVFDSATNQAGVDTNGAVDVYLRNRQAGTTERVSISSTETQGSGTSHFADVSDNGQYVVFQTSATDLVTDPDTNGKEDVVLRDRSAGTTVLLSRTPGGVAGNGGASTPTISDNGTKVSFSSSSSDLVAGDTNGLADGFIRTVGAGSTTRVSVKTAGGQAAGLVFSCHLSGNGAVLAFTTLAEDMISTDTNDTFDVFWRGTMDVGPFANSLQFLQRQAMDFTGKSFTVGQVVAANNALLDGIASPESTVTALAHGAYDDHTGPVMRLYWSFFHRVPDRPGLNYWVNKHVAGASLYKIAASFAASSEFKNTYGSLSNTAFVTLIYENVLGRAPDPAGLTYWVGKLNNGLSRGQVMVAYSESSEGVRIMRPQVDAFLLYLGMLDRLPTLPELNSVVKPMAVQGSEVLVTSLLHSLEYGGSMP